MALFYGASPALVFEYGPSVYVAPLPPPEPGGFLYGAPEAGYFDYGVASAEAPADKNGGDGGGESGGRIKKGAKRKEKPRFLVEVDGKFIVTGSEKEAQKALRPAKQGKKAKPAASVVSLEVVNDPAETVGQAEKYSAAVEAQNAKDLQAIFEQMQREDDDEVEMLLLSL
jgi:hypothetical protein